MEARNMKRLPFVLTAAPGAAVTAGATKRKWGAGMFLSGAFGNFCSVTASIRRVLNFLPVRWMICPQVWKSLPGREHCR